MISYSNTVNNTLIKAASQSLQVNLYDEYIVINYLILSMLKNKSINNYDNILHSTQLGLSAFHYLFQLPELKLNNSINIKKNILYDYDQSIVQLIILSNLSESFRCILNNNLDDTKKHNKIVVYIMKRYSYINSSVF